MRRNPKTAFVVFHGETPGGTLCGLVNGARRANVLDLLEKARSTGAFGELALFTDSEDLAGESGGLADRVVMTRPGRIHFGKAIAAAGSLLPYERICYFGSGAGAFAGEKEFVQLAAPSGPNDVFANNLYSTDFCAFSNAGGLSGAVLPSTDNAFSRLLIEKAGFKGRELPRALGTMFDIDAPLDLTALKLSGMARGRLGEFVARKAPKAGHLKRALKVFTRRTSEVTVAGRVSADVHMFLDRRSACRVRLITEERGLVASGSGQAARSITGMWLGGGNPGEALETLAGRTHAAFLDSRLLLACAGEETEAEDRFASDLLQTERIGNRYLRRLSEAARDSRYPVVLANHSLLNGGMMLLVEAAWRSFGRRPVPKHGLRSDPPPARKRKN